MLVCFLACSRCQERMDRQRLFSRAGSENQGWKVRSRPHLSVGADALWNGRSQQVRNSRRRSVTMAASLTYADPLRLPDATINSCSRTQAPPTKRPCGGTTCACTQLADGGSCRGLALAETKLTGVSKKITKLETVITVGLKQCFCYLDILGCRMQKCLLSYKMIFLCASREGA